jgi:hypothetical protein
VSQKTQQRLVQRQEFAETSSTASVTRMSLDGGMIRLRTPKGEESEWKEFKAINLIG